jgi:SAM-dependent methyltransferase
MILSRTMRESDYKELEEEGKVILEIQKAIGMWYEYQHHHRVWEYSLAQKALKAVHGDRKHLLVSDQGCGAGYMGPILLWLGHNVLLYEHWGHGSNNLDLSEYMLEQMRRVALHRSEIAGYYELRNRPLGQMVEEDRGVDAAFCISTLEHIRDYQKAFRDFLSTVKVGGLAFVTTDFADKEEDNYACSSLRAGKMFTVRTYRELWQIGIEMGFRTVDSSTEHRGDISDWCWGVENRLVMDYGFASLALRREA